ncbi:MULTISPECIES: acyl-CoA dehydrogenase family protein [Pseudofrankia]|uniref:acyl-CoA dehydrogenase family protein n=1 Tax=Pseudofrankia TaxID=2994363 RepID=UPI000234BA1F|nr:MULTISPECIES: acyl-CoA dehydrogenase family protein [Pseudofrankia]OHV41614.1 acyl-CoA dehydrogenase [Pseudofrankia sp. EUN1h]
MTADAGVEDVESFRRRAAAWMRGNLRAVSGPPTHNLDGLGRSEDEELAEITRQRQLQRVFFDGGFAGICVPREYGGQGLTPAHQRAFNEEIAGYEFPMDLQSPTFNPCLAVLLEFGTEEQKRQHVPAILRGDEIWMQFLSEPSGGSDVAGALTSAVRDGDEWVLNGSKIWTTGAWYSDWALCLARTNWDVPKHRGLTVFILPLLRDGVELTRIEMVNGNREFCQEYLTDVRVPDSDRIGEVDGGWTVGTRWMFHEKMLYNSPYITMPAGLSDGFGAGWVSGVARDAARLGDPHVRGLVGEAHMLDLAAHALQRRVALGLATGRLSDQAAAVARLFTGVATSRRTEIAFDIAGPLGGTWTEQDGEAAGSGLAYLVRQATCIGGGTTEMARNVVSERLLGMPREPALDRDRPFRDVPRGPATRT